MSSGSSAVMACLIDVTAASRLVANMLEHAVRDPHWHTQSQEEVPHAREDNSSPSHETGLSVSPTIDDGPSSPALMERTHDFRERSQAYAPSRAQGPHRYESGKNRDPADPLARWGPRRTHRTAATQSLGSMAARSGSIRSWNWCTTNSFSGKFSSATIRAT